MRSRVAAACAGVLLVAGCQDQTPPTPPPTPPPTSASVSVTPTGAPTPTVVTRSWRLPLAPLTQPVYVHGVAVVLATINDALAVVAVDPHTGDRLWSRPATTSAVSIEEPLVVAVVGDDVAYYRPASSGGSSARLVIADVHTGQDLVTSPVEVFSTPIEPCDDPVTRLCGTARPYLDTAATRYSFVISTGRFGPAPGDQPPVESRPVGPGGLIDLGNRAPERVGVFKGDRLLWSMPVVAYFPEGTTSDAGWTFTMSGERYIGTLEQPFPSDGEVDMANIATASFEAATGKIAWSVRGTSLDCLGTVVVPSDVSTRCRYSGDAVFTAGEPDFSDVNVTVEGFDPDNGKRTWEFELGKGVGLLRGVRVPALIGESSLLLGRGADQRVVDLRTGDQSLPTEGSTYLCPTLTTFQADRGELTGDPLFSPCTALRSRTTGEPSVATLSALHQTIGALVVVAGPEGLTGYRLTAP